MPIAGRAVMINWSNVAAADRPAYYAWHDREHIAGVVALPGVQRGRRHIAVAADRDFFNIYEVDDLAVLTGEAYRAKVNNPSELTRRTTKVVTDAFRALAHVRLSLGTGSGTSVLTLRFDVAEDGTESLGRHLAETALPAIAAMDGIVGVHWFVADMPASTYVSEERRGRPTEVPNWVVMIEGVTPEAVAAAGNRHLAEPGLVAAGARGPFARGLYAQQIAIAKLPGWKG